MSLHVDFDGMSKARARLDGLSQDSRKIAETAKDADPEWYVWGLTGIPLAAAYFPLADDVHRHLADLAEALSANATRLDHCARQYREKEEDNTRAMETIRRRLDGRPA